MTKREESLKLGEALVREEELINKITMIVESEEAKGDTEIRQDTMAFVNVLIKMFELGDESKEEFIKDEAYDRAMKVI